MNELGRVAQQELIDGSRSSADRNREGQFATPFPLALEIVRLMKSLWPAEKPVEFLEPCVGTGAFYSAMRAEFATLDRAVGIEKDQELSQAAAT